MFFLGVLPLSAATTREERAYLAAVNAFHDQIWDRAATGLAQFVEKYPKSTNAPEAVLLEAEAEFKQDKFPQAISLLQTRADLAGPLADQYRYWIGQAQVSNHDYSAAAGTFISLARDFPESRLRLPSAVVAASALAEARQWPQVLSLLNETNGIFRRTQQLDPTNELVARGCLLLAQALFAQNDFAGAAAVLESVNPQSLPAALDWQRVYFLCQVRLAAGDLSGALAATTNLAAIVPAGNDAGLRATVVALRADVLQRMGRTDAALAAYRENLAHAPPAQEREAILKITELDILQGQLANAGDALNDFLAQFTNSADIALLTAGELHLKEYDAAPAVATNQLAAAFDAFDRFIATYTNSPFLGKAYLDRGWCEWLMNPGFPESPSNSLDDFEQAARDLPPSEDLAVARFKMGDALFALTNYHGALENYRAVLDDFAGYPEVGRTLGARALYQSLRADLALNDSAGASNLLARLLEEFPSSEMAPGGNLLYGETLAEANRPAAARGVFQEFLRRWPEGPLRPEVEFAIARTYQLEQDWPAAIAAYQAWLAQNPTNRWRAKTAFSLARTYAAAGDVTDAFAWFNSFATQFPDSPLAPQAQWWVADYYFGLGGTNYLNAEKDYELIYQNQNFPTNDLAYPAKMMAGRAAAARQDYAEASQDYFSKLENDTNCPPNLWVEATLANGQALMLTDTMDTNNPLGNFSNASNLLMRVVQLNPTNEAAARAWGQIGVCEMQMGNAAGRLGNHDLQIGGYAAATNAYAQVLNTNLTAGVSLRSEAQVGIGIVLEKEAALPGADQKALLQLALDNYLDVFFGNNLRDGETADPFWVKEAGFQALPLIEKLGTSSPDRFIDQMEHWLPQLKDSLEKKRADWHSKMG